MVLDGEGIDNLMHFQLKPYLKDLARRGEFGTLVGAAAGYFWEQRSRWWRLGLRLKNKLDRKKGHSLPEWIAPELKRRVNVDERMKAFELPHASPSHPVLPDGHASFGLPQWTRMFEVSDAGFTRQEVEVRYPFLDLRIVEFMLALPPYPLFLRKKLERDAMARKLPANTLRRPKTALVGEPGSAAVTQSAGWSWNWEDEIDAYVDRRCFPGMSEGPYSAHGSHCIRAACFNFWLQSRRGVRYNLSVEVS